MSNTLADQVQQGALADALERVDGIVKEEASQAFYSLTRPSKAEEGSPYHMTLDVVNNLGKAIHARLGGHPQYNAIALCLLDAIDQTIKQWQAQALQDLYLTGKAAVYDRLNLIEQLEKILKQYKKENL